MVSNAADSPDRAVQENEIIRQELLHYRTQIFQLQLVAPTVGVFILQADSGNGLGEVLVPIAAGFVLLLSMHALNRQYQALNNVVGYLRWVVRSPYEENWARFREQIPKPRLVKWEARLRDRRRAEGDSVGPSGRKPDATESEAHDVRPSSRSSWTGRHLVNPASGRLGVASFVVHSVVLAFAEMIAYERAALHDRISLWWIASGVGIVPFVAVSSTFFRLPTYRDDVVDKVWRDIGKR